MTTFKPSNVQDVLEIVRWAAAETEPLEVIGYGSKRAIGQVLRTSHVLDVSGLTGITLYEPEELVLSAKAGTPLSEIEALLAKNGQELAFEPMDYAPLLKGEVGRGTIGGVLAANLSGPRRLKAGAARDHVLGIRAVSGRGEVFKSGGRVVKNVTGYDLSKIMAGSWGTLAVVTDVTFKVLPRAETEATLVVKDLSEEQAAAAMALAMGSSAEVSGAAHLPESVAGRVLERTLRGKGATILRLEGFAPSVAYRFDLLAKLLSNQGVIEKLDAEQSKQLWREIRDCKPFADGSPRPVWRISMAPTQAHHMVMGLRMEAAVDAFYDWQGGLVWLRMEMEPEADAVRRLIAAHGGGHATLVRAAPAWRGAIAVFQPQPPALAALSSGLKQQFDLHNILNPGKMGF